MTDVGAAYAEFQRTLGERVAPSKVLYSKVWGSHSHGCETPESDIDFTGVYVWGLRDALRLTPPPETVEGKGPDFQAHEIGKFLRLLMKGNPATVECLFTEKWYMATGGMGLLISSRDMFINQTTLKQYLGYARGQLQRLKNGTRIHTKGGGRPSVGHGKCDSCGNEF